MFLERVYAADLKPEDLDLIIEADNQGDEFHSLLMDFVPRLWNGTFQLYRFPNGCLLTEVHEGTAAKRINILRFAGNMASWDIRKIAEDLQHIARETGCVAIETVVYCPKLAKAICRAGAKQESVTLVMGVD